jgi:hypothetical protein
VPFYNNVMRRRMKGWKLFLAGLAIAVFSSQIAKSLASSGDSLSLFFDSIDVGGLIMMLVAAAEGIYWLVERLRHR